MLLYKKALNQCYFRAILGSKSLVSLLRFIEQIHWVIFHCVYLSTSAFSYGQAGVYIPKLFRVFLHFSKINSKESQIVSSEKPTNNPSDPPITDMKDISG